MVKSLIKLDLINSVAFMVTSLFIWYTIEERDSKENNQKNMFLLAPEIVFFIGILINNYQGHKIVRIEILWNMFLGGPQIS